MNDKDFMLGKAIQMDRSIIKPVCTRRMTRVLVNGKEIQGVRTLRISFELWPGDQPEVEFECDPDKVQSVILTINPLPWYRRLWQWLMERMK